MKYLVVYAHPNPKSFCHAVKEKILEKLRLDGVDAQVRDLYKMKFNPVLSADDFVAFMNGKVPEDIRTEQDFVRSADTVIFVYPVWWFSMPAILKGYIDRVFAKGFAYDIQGNKIKGLLSGKKVMVFNTTGGPAIAYFFMQTKAAIDVAIDQGIFKFCGMKVLMHKFFYAVPFVSDHARKKMLEGIDLK